MISSSAPAFSVIVPLEFHRGQWETCIQKWCDGQDFPRRQYEVIAVVPPSFSSEALARLAALLSPYDRLERTNVVHDISLVAIGARISKGDFLVFTEAHCIPKADVLRKSLAILEAKPDWAAFSGRSIRITHNRLSEAEADMYEDDIEFGMHQHKWRKVLDQCFVTRRKAYYHAGGFEPDFGHFSEWVLAANYYALGYTIGYAPDVELEHYYIGEFDELRTFTRDFVDGEMRYFARGSFGPGGALLEAPPEWKDRRNFHPKLARRLVRVAFHELAAFRSIEKLGLAGRAIRRWLFALLRNGKSARASAKMARYTRWLAVVALHRLGTRRQLKRAFIAYVASIIREQRLESLANLPLGVGGAPESSPTDAQGRWDLLSLNRNLSTGLFEVESFEGTKFRWSEPIAMIEGWLPAGDHVIHIECLPLASREARPLPRFFIDEIPIAKASVISRGNDFEIAVKVPQAGIHRLAWLCSRFHAEHDRRHLGLPIQTVCFGPA
jgi:hypothetical protein